MLLKYFATIEHVISRDDLSEAMIRIHDLIVQPQRFRFETAKTDLNLKFHGYGCRIYHNLYSKDSVHNKIASRKLTNNAFIPKQNAK